MPKQVATESRLSIVCIFWTLYHICEAHLTNHREPVGPFTKTIFHGDLDNGRLKPVMVVNFQKRSYPGSKVYGANMVPTWVLSAPDGPHVGPRNFAIGVVAFQKYVCWCHGDAEPPSHQHQKNRLNTYCWWPLLKKINSLYDNISKFLYLSYIFLR